MAKRKNYSSGRTYEELCGYSRAVRVDEATSFICVGGTTSTNQDGDILHVGDAYAQAREALDIIKTALEALGATLNDVVRTRIYVVQMSVNQDEICRAHHDVFGTIRPSETMVGVSELSHPDMLVEIEAEAIL